MTKFFVAVVFALTVLMYPMASRAACDIVGTIVRVSATGTASPNSFVFMRSPLLTTNSHVFVGITQVPQVIAAASVAVALQTKAFISGNATSCPTTGFLRSVGNIRVLILNP